MHQQAAPTGGQGFWWGTQDHKTTLSGHLTQPNRKELSFLVLWLFLNTHSSYRRELDLIGDLEARPDHAQCRVVDLLGSNCPWGGCIPGGPHKVWRAKQGGSPHGEGLQHAASHVHGSKYNPGEYQLPISCVSNSLHPSSQARNSRTIWIPFFLVSHVRADFIFNFIFNFYLELDKSFI